MSDQTNQSSDVPAHLVAAVADSPPEKSEDKIAAVRALCEDLWALEAEMLDLEGRLEDVRARRHHLRVEVLPDKMDEIGVAAVELAARGNYPAVRVEVRPDVSANIAAEQSPKNPRGWPEEKRRAAFDWLDANGQGDLIKTTITTFFPRERRADAVEVAKQIAALKLDVEVKEAVHSATLTSWLKERVKRGLATPLDVIGGHVGRVATAKVEKSR